MTLRSLVILCELEPDAEHYEPPTKLFNGSWGFCLIWLLLRCVGVLRWFVKRDLVERSMIHECSNHVHRGKTQHETCSTLAVHDSRTARKLKTLSTMTAKVVSVVHSQLSDTCNLHNPTKKPKNQQSRKVKAGMPNQKHTSPNLTITR